FFNNANVQNKYRFRLDSVQIRDKFDLTAQSYSFGYRTDVLLPDYINSKSKDLWGYFNNQANNTLVPSATITISSYDGSVNTPQSIGGNRDPNPAVNQAYTLNRMTFPTGGYSEFDFETNQYWDV